MIPQDHSLKGYFVPALFCLVITISSCAPVEQADHPRQALSLLGQELYAPLPTASLLADLDSARALYDSDSTNADNLVWYGRRMAYLGRYQEAIELFSRGVDRFPNDARFLRHRGHRYISTRQFDMAIDDLERAALLVTGTEDEIEPDGMPNEQNIPLTTLHSNIFYHLGLAYYLAHDWDHALRWYTACRDLGLNDDNLVSSTHWMYMILRRMGQEEEAQETLTPITPQMDIVENQSYWKLCLYYKDTLSEHELIDSTDAAPSNDAVRYGVANRYLYGGDSSKAKVMFEEIISAPSWSSFGYIAAEADLAALERYQKQ